eukprot:6193006-Pleurochrysis_carterae.AAC.1
MLCKAVLHAQNCSELSVTARDAGRAVSKYPEPVPAQAATSLNYSTQVVVYYKMRLSFNQD